MGLVIRIFVSLINLFMQLPMLVQMIVFALIVYWITQVFHYIASLWWLFVTIAIIGVIFLIVSYLHEVNKLPLFVKKQDGVMRFLDRLTNKPQAIEETKKSFTFNPEALSAFAQESVYGYKTTCDFITKRLRNRLAMSGRTKPIAVFMFAGSPGTGKTLLAKTLAEGLHQQGYGSSEPYLLIDMTRFNTAYSREKLEKRLAVEIKKSAKQIIILDEFEKAEDSIRQFFLHPWEEGFFEDNEDHKISVTEVIFIITTNAGQNEIEQKEQKEQKENYEKKLSRCKEIVTPLFSKELLSRCDYVFPFPPLRGINLAQVILKLMIQHAEHHNLTLTKAAPEIIFKYTKKALENKDTREIQRIIEEEFGDKLYEHTGSISINKEGIVR